MSIEIETLQSQIDALREKKSTLQARSDQSVQLEYDALIESLEQMIASAARELDNAQAEIEAERQSIQNFFGASSDAYFATDSQGVIREVNAISGVLLGTPAAALIGKPIASYVAAQEQHAFLIQLAGLLKSGNFHQWETVLVRESAQPLNVAIKLSILHDHEGNVTDLRWWIHDLTRHQELEKRLQRDSGRLLESQQIGHVGSWEWDVEKNEVAWSDEMYRIYGLQPQSEKITYERFLAFIHKDDLERIHATVESSRETHEPFSYSHRIVRPNGTIRHVHAHGIMLQNDAGETIRMFGSAQDITEQKLAQEELQRLNVELEQRVEQRTRELTHANERLKRIVVERAHHQESIQKLNRELDRRVAELQTVLNVLPIGVTVAYDRAAAYITTNSTGQKMLGISRSENIPSADHGVQNFKVTREDRELPINERPLMIAMDQRQIVRDAELDLKYSDGTDLNILTYASPLYDEHDQVRGGVLAFIDITSRKLIEKRLALQYAVSRALAESNGLSEASSKILELICTEMDWALGIFWTFDRDANHLYVENTWQRPGTPDNMLVDASRKLFSEPGETLAGSVYLSREPVWLSSFDERADFPRKDAALQSGYQGLVSFPLSRGDQEVFGVMEFFSAHIQPSTPDLSDMFNAFANQVGEFMGRTYAEHLRATQVNQQVIITELSQNALLSDNLGKFLTDVCVRINQTLSVDYCNILELIPEKQQLLFRAVAGWDESLMHTPLELRPDSHFFYVLSDNQPISINELSTENRFPIAPFLAEHEIISGMSVVISGRAHAFGLLEAYSRRRRNFTQDDLRFLQGAAHVIAAAIQQHEVQEALRLSRNQIAVILSGIADGITVLDTNGKLIYANDAAARLIGYASTAELTSTPVDRITAKFEICDESGEPLEMSQLPGRLALQGEYAQPLVVRFKVLETMEERWSVVNAQSVRNEAGQVMMSVSIFHDITDMKRAELAQHLLAETSILLAADLDYDTRMNNLAKLLVPSLGDWCAIDILDEHQILQRSAVMHIDPQMLKWGHEMHKRYPPDPNANGGAYKVIRNNKSEYHPIIPKEAIDAIADPEQRALVQKLGLSSLIIVPLSARGNTFGTLSLIWAESHHHYSPDDLTLAEELARRAALALDNARLYEDAQSLNAELEDRVNRRTNQLQRTNARLVGEVNERKLIEEQFRRLNIELEERVVERTSEQKATNRKLQREIVERELADQALQISLQKTRELYEISQAMGLVNTPDELLHALLSSSYLASAIRASVAIFDHVWQKDDAAPATCTIITAWNKLPDTLLYIGQEMTLLEYGLTEPYSRNEPFMIHDIRVDPDVNQVMRQRLINVGVVSSVIFPLIAGGEWYGVLSFHFNDVIEFGSDDIRHLEGLVDEIAMGIYNFRLLEAEAHARREAEEANKLKLNFLAMVSHELRTPLTSIKGFSTTLLADDVEWKAESQRDFIETISVEADKLTELIEQLLNVSRLESGSIRITQRRVEWNQVLLTSMAQLNALTANHQLDIKVAELDFPVLYVDVMRISQVVTNLVTNATRYSPQNTTITIEAENLSDKFIKVRVMDQGVGIPQEARQRVFEAFHQLDREKGGTQGAGLGLSICRGLIEAHGGRIWVEDEHTGPGTTISFTLPIAES